MSRLNRSSSSSRTNRPPDLSGIIAMARTPKSQIPNPKSQTVPRLQISKGLHLFHAFWNLEFGASLELWIWGLGFFSSEIFAHVVVEVVNRGSQRHGHG